MGLKIAVTGHIRSGKDSVCDYIYNSNWGSNFKILYFAEGIEEIIRRYFPEAFEGNNKPRKYYQVIGQFMRTVNPDVWVNYTNKQYERFLFGGFQNFLVTDLRQHNEYDWLKENGFTVIKVEAEPEIRLERMRQAGDKFNLEDLNHETEQQINDLKYDYLITNNTTLEDLYKQVDFILDELREEEGGYI